MARHDDTTSTWPTLPAYRDWQDVCTTLHMWVQIVGKTCLALAPWINHSWGTTLHVTARGLVTPTLYHQGRALDIEFDFIDHRLRVRTDDGQSRTIPLTAMPVAEFYRACMQLLGELGIPLAIHPRPVEVVEAIPFDQDRVHAAYDPRLVQRFWRALLQVDRVFKRFRAGFIGKSSPVHFFWGSFDLAVSRFSGRTAPAHPGGAPHCPDWVMREAYSHEVASAGFWPGAGLGEAAFYAYIYPAPEGYAASHVEPAAAYHLESLGEFILPYAAVQGADDPDATLLAFLESSYAAAAELAGWDRAALECKLPPPSG